MPSHFEIVPLPSKIASWLISLLSRLLVNEQYRETHTRTKLGRGKDGQNIANPSDSATTLTSTASTNTSESNSWEPLPWLCAKGVSQETMDHWLREQSEVPCSGRTDGQTHERRGYGAWMGSTPIIQSLQEQRPESRASKGCAALGHF